MRYADYYDCDICNGNEVGMSLFVSGCPFHCRGCFNSEIWDYESGKRWTEEVEKRFLELVGRKYIKRITFVGGDPLCDNNALDVYALIKKIREIYPDKKIWIYTGYTWEEIFINQNTDDASLAEICRQKAVANCDILIDGRFEIDKKDLSLAFRGSTNQRIIDVKESMKTNQIVLAEYNNY